jgi:uncharacterized protein YceH (UPF0502 family)
MERLDAVEARVLATLVEKELTTPQQYPLSLNAVVAGCNQTSNREPVTSFTDGDARAALDRLKANGLVRFVLPSHGRSVVRYRHVVGERLGLDRRRSALVAVLLLRGPQTAGELRTRTERMADFAALSEVEADLERLAAEEQPLVARLERRPGQKEERWAELLSDHGEVERDPADAGDGLREEVARLREEVAQLRSEVAELKDQVLTSGL